MNITLSAKQYENLVKLISYGMWVTVSENQDSTHSEFREIEQLILSQAAAHGYAGINYHSEENFYEPGALLENEINAVLDSYEEIVFWDKLAYYMARRDFQQGIEHKNNENSVDRLIDLEEKYHTHFEENGVSKLKIVE
jgi:hypothetical protein